MRRLEPARRTGYRSVDGHSGRNAIAGGSEPLPDPDELGPGQHESLKRLTDIDVRYSRVTPNGVAHFAPHFRQTRFDSTERCCRRATWPARPSRPTRLDQAIAAWVKAPGRYDRFTGGHVVAVNLSSTSVSDAQLGNLAELRRPRKNWIYRSLRSPTRALTSVRPDQPTELYFTTPPYPTPDLRNSPL